MVDCEWFLREIRRGAGGGTGTNPEVHARDAPAPSHASELYSFPTRMIWQLTMFSLVAAARGFGLTTTAARPTMALQRAASSAISMEATGPVCVVTGGSRGLGRSIALALGGAGCRVVVNYASSAAAAEAVVEEIKGLGGDGVAVQADMSTTDGIKGLFKATADAFDDPVEVLVNNAGITRDTLAMRMKESQWTDVINTNLNG